MAISDVLPDRPLSRNEVDSIESHEGINGIFPMYGEQPENRDTAYATVIVVGETAYALSFTDDAWAVVEKQPIDANDHGIAFDEHETISELHAAAALESDAVKDHVPE